MHGRRKDDRSLKRQRSSITYGMHASHREQRWEPQSASLIERDPEVIPDVNIAAHVGKDLFLDEKIPRHESGQGYVREWWNIEYCGRKRKPPKCPHTKD
jgi:hypothetical protein